MKHMQNNLNVLGTEVGFPKASTLHWPKQGKYNVVNRALPYKDSEKSCRWQRTVTPNGRVVLEPIP